MPMELVQGKEVLLTVFHTTIESRMVNVDRKDYDFSDWLLSNQACVAHLYIQWYLYTHQSIIRPSWHDEPHGQAP